MRPVLRDLLRPRPGVRLRQARLHRGLRLRPLYRNLEQRVLPVRQRRPQQLHRAEAEEHRHRHGPGAVGLRVSERGQPVRRGHGDEHHPQGQRADRRALRRELSAGREPARHHRPHPLRHVYDLRRHPAQQRGPGLRAAPSAAPGRPPRQAAGRERAVFVSGGGHRGTRERVPVRRPAGEAELYHQGHPHRGGELCPHHRRRYADLRRDAGGSQGEGRDGVLRRGRL